MTILSPVHAIARVTFLEILRDRILYSIALIAVLLLGVALLASQLTFIGPNRVVLDIGLSAVQISMSMIGVFLGASVVNREFERRTAYVALSRPISRAHFLAGKYLGVAYVIALNGFLLSLAYLAVAGLASDQGFGEMLSLLGSTLGKALLLALMQAWVLTALSMAFSTFSTTMVSVFLGIGLYLVGVNVPEIRMIAAKSEQPAVASLLKGAAAAIPDLATFNLGLKVTYDLPVPATYVWAALAYGFAWIFLSLTLGCILIRTKDT